ncbi:MAG TPA: molybdopterin cofactor-binding domain-containing protein [Burkholderiales bacterium]|nr:molybdopterin cofactor-binding domain-containing protein [Burkholderiales bacterium]
MTRYVGRSVPRVEDQRFLTGQGRYTDDLSLEGELHCVFVRSPHAHARIARIHAGAAPGATVLTGADYAADGLDGIRHVPNPADALDVSKRAFSGRVVDLPHFPLATDRARHVGEAVAMVIASSRERARDAAERVVVDYEILPAVVAPAGALAPGAPRLHDAAPGNVCVEESFGDAAAVREALGRAAHVVRRELRHNRVASCQMEPRAAIGDWDAKSGTHTLISGNQGVASQRAAIAQALKVAPERVRVVCPDVGGAFGLRTNVYPEQLAVVWAARRVGRPVKWTGDRGEAFLADYQGRDAITRAALGFDRDGRIVAYDLEWIADVGAHTVSFVPMSNGRRILSTVYHVPLAHAAVKGALTNTVPTAPYRGAGRPEAMHAIERLLDIAAREMGLDRVEIRRRNLVRLDQLPYRTVMGFTYDSGDFAGYLERALELADWSGFPARKRKSEDSGKLRGIGVANHVEAPVGAPVEEVRITALPSGEVEVIAGTQSTGQGHETTFAQVVADRLGVDIAAVRIRYGDTAYVAGGGGTHSDRSMRIAGSLIVQASDGIVDQAKAAASRLLEAAPQDLVFESGKVRVAGTDRALGLAEIARSAELAASAKFFGRMPAHPAGAAVCELEIDRETGAVRVVRYTAVDDVGQAVNPAIVAGQVHGGIAQGLGQALCERVALDAEGQVASGSFLDYCVPRADDLPDFRTDAIEHPTAGNALRVKGGGEGGIMPATAAAVNALCDALGADDLDMPATPQRVWQALRLRERIAARSLLQHPEAMDLVVAEVDAGGREHRLVPAAARAWSALSTAARADGVSLEIVSAFRSVERQAQILRAKQERGLPIDEILRVSAPPGYSEHHSGRAVDVTTDGVRPLEEEFERTAAFEWLQRNAGRFGFHLSFPRGNDQGYAYEPWHWCWHAPEPRET